MGYKHWHFQFWGFMSSNLQNSGQHRPLEWYFNGVLKLPILQIPMALYFQNSGHHSPRKWYFMGVLALLIRNIPMAFWVQSCQIPATIAQNIGIANFSHFHGLMSSKLQNSGHRSPLEWYFTWVQPLPLPIIHIPIALWFLDSGHHRPLKWYSTGVQPSSCQNSVVITCLGSKMS